MYILSVEYFGRNYCIIIILLQTEAYEAIARKKFGGILIVT